MAKRFPLQQAKIKLYRGYGHQHNLVIYGHVLQKEILNRSYTNNILSNITHLLTLFFVKPLAGVKVQMQWGPQLIESISEMDGFFKFEWASVEPTPAGWHNVQVIAVNENNMVLSTATGEIFIPHITQFAFISDIDDTVMISFSATIFKRLKTLFINNPNTRKVFDDVANHYRMLSNTHTTPDVPNPFFYVSSSEWNLYNDLVDFFNYNKLPEGAFLLSQLKKWYQLVKTGKTKHEAKLLKVYRILEAFPKQQFVLIGDNSQADPDIYTKIAKRYPQNIFAIYIRSVVEDHIKKTNQLLEPLANSGVHTCCFVHSSEAILHGRKIGLIDK